MRPVSTSCADHMGSTWARMHTWDGAKWNFSSDWYQADESILKPLVKASADKYAAEKKLTARTPTTARAEPRRLSPTHPRGAPLAPGGPDPRPGPSRSAASRAKSPRPDRMSNILLNVNGIEVIYNHVILVLKGVSLKVPEGGWWRCWAATAPARRPRCARSATCWPASAARSPRAASNCAASASRS
jgi:hypothetical protein